MKKILLIEDNLDMRENIAEILELSSYEVRTANNGKEGVALAKEWAPDLVLCDIMMPELDGYGVLHMLGKNPLTAKLPFIFLTAKADKSDVRKGMSLGADDYLTKPFDEMELLEAIEVRLKKNEITTQSFDLGIDGFQQFVEEARGLKQLEELSHERKFKHYKKKEPLFREGDYANFLYCIVKGKVKCTKTDDYGKDIVTDLFGPGDYFGYMALLEGPEYHETAVALEDLEVAVIPKDDFLMLMQKNRDVAAKFISMLTNNVYDKEERLLHLAYSPVRERVARALLDVHSRFNHPAGKSGIQFSREDLASIVGTATESLIRQLSDFKDEGLIIVEGREISISDKNGLEKIAGRV